MIFDFFEKIFRFFVYKVFRLKFSEEQYGKIWQFVMYAAVGVSNTLVSYIFFELFYKVVGLSLEVSNFLGFSISVVNACYWSNKYVFKAEDGVKRVWWKTFIKTYISYALFGLILHTALLKLMVEKWGISAIVAPIILIFVITPLNFIANKFWAYKDKREEIVTDGEDCNQQA